MTKKSKEPPKVQTLRSRFSEVIYVAAPPLGCGPSCRYSLNPLAPFSDGDYVGEYHLASISKIEKVVKLVDLGVKGQREAQYDPAKVD